MNKTAIKTFAVSARKKLLEGIQQKANELGITKNKMITPEICQDGFRINDKFFQKYQIKQREGLLHKIKIHGFDKVVEDVAYTWFNRLIAIRFMEVNDYLPIGIRILSSIDSGKAQPDAVSRVLTIANDLELDVTIVHQLLNKNDIEELFKYIFVKQCNKLGEMIPVMFEEIEDYTVLLLPDELLSEGSVIRDLVDMIPEGDWIGQVEIIGWLYQYYISEKKDRVFADLKKNKKISKENIPAATQLFTPKWIAQYMVENSLGRLWLDAHPDEDLQTKWNYYLEAAPQSQEITETLENIISKNLLPEEIKILDPCMGTGHILVYAFDVLYAIYFKAGYNEQDIPGLILTNNIYGLDIDDCAAELAYFALLMKARSYNRYILNQKLDLNVASIQESNDLPSEAIDFFAACQPELKESLNYLRVVFHDAKEYGSIINVRDIDFKAIENLLTKLDTSDADDLFSCQYKLLVKEKLPPLLKQLKILNQKYKVTITNPPYMGFKGMDKALFDYVKKYYPDSKTDLFAVFLEKIMDFTEMNGYTACITQHSWMFLSRYEKLRKKMLSEQTICSMVHLGTKAFEDIGGEVVQTTAYVGRNIHLPKLCAPYIRLLKYDHANLKHQEFFNPRNRYFTSQDIYFDLPTAPIAYWTSGIARGIFKNNKKLIDIGTPNTGLQTSDNNRFLRFWFEVDKNKIGFGIKSNAESVASDKKWFPYNKGGTYRKWFGNQEYLVNWENNGAEIRMYNNFLNSSRSSNIGIGSVEFYFREGISWSKIGTEAFSVRYSPEGFIFDVGGSSLFPNGEEIYLLLALLNSKTTLYFLSLLNPTMNFQVGNISSIPIPDWTEYMDDIEQLSKENIAISKNDWDSFETSWNYKRHPFLLSKFSTIQEAYKKWAQQKLEQRMKLKKNEEKLNRLFIKMYGLQDELNPLVLDSEITLAKENLKGDIKSFVSYAVGCMFGRYSLSSEGMVYSGGEFDLSKYDYYFPVSDNIIPVTDEEYFEDDIAGRFIKFVGVTFGLETLEQNLDFIAEALIKKGSETARQRLRRYFLKEFYKDHLQTYQKRPIYWLLESGKNDGFKALIYMHRYDTNTIAKVRTDYLHVLQRNYEGELIGLDMLAKSAMSPQEKAKAKKQKEKIERQLQECLQYDQAIAYAANQKIKIDLDDGVKVNYERFQNIEVVQQENKIICKVNLLAEL